VGALLVPANRLASLEAALELPEERRAQMFLMAFAAE
jgi:hypothetical protein